MNENVNKKKKKSSALNIIIIAGAAVAVAALFMVFNISSEDSASKKVYDELREYTYTETVESPVSEDGAYTEGNIRRIIDFDSLKEMNPDIIAWIELPAAGVDYPVLKGTEDNYYLSHGADGIANRSGSIFLDNANNYDFSDPNTIVYGHRMNNGSMFGSLKVYEDESVFDQNREIILYTPENGAQVYEIFSAYKTGTTSDTYTLFTRADEEFTGYVSDMAAKSLHTLDGFNCEDVTQMLTLSTCVKDDAGSRFVIQAMKKEA